MTINGMRAGRASYPGRCSSYPDQLLQPCHEPSVLGSILNALAAERLIELACANRYVGETQHACSACDAMDQSLQLFSSAWRAASEQRFDP